MPDLMGAFACLFAAIAAFVLWRLERKGPAENITRRRFDKWE